MLQAMDSGGKDGSIKTVRSTTLITIRLTNPHQLSGGLAPYVCRVVSFKVPSEEEAAHDFLWRIEKQSPKKGESEWQQVVRSADIHLTCTKNSCDL